MVNSAAIVASVRVDQMLVTTLRGPTENGVYAAAQRLTEVIYFLPVAVMTAANPILLRWHARDPVEYRRRLTRVFRVLGLVGLAVAITVSVAAQPLALLLFGSGFHASGPVLAILVWACPALFLGVAQTNWFIAEGRQRGLMVRSVVAAIVGLALNAWLVPAMGARGAAIAMAVSQTVAHWGLNALSPSTRGVFVLQCRALLPWARA
jgi:PST family polysaccharide transporter